MHASRRVVIDPDDRREGNLTVPLVATTLRHPFKTTTTWSP